MPLPFIGSRKKEKQAPPPQHRVALPPDTLEFEEASLRLQYHSMSSHGVRLPNAEKVPVLLPKLLEGFATQVELIEPLDETFQNAAPQLLRPQVALEWINAHHGRSQIGRHALYILNRSMRSISRMRRSPWQSSPATSTARDFRVGTR